MRMLFFTCRVTCAILPVIIAGCTAKKTPAVNQDTTAVRTVASDTARGEQRSGPQLMLETDLRDGSKIMGTADVSRIHFRSSYGDVSLPLDQIMTISLPDSAEAARVEFRNGDILRGSLGADSLPVMSAAGRVVIPFAAILRVVPVPPRSDPDRGLIAWYPLESDCRDATGHGHNGTNHGATPAEGWSGAPSRAFGFDGREARIVLPEGIIDPEDSACTIALWALACSASQFRQAVYIGAATGELSISVRDGRFTFGADLSSRRWYTVSDQAEENKFVHLAGVYSRGKTLTLYVNGAVAAETALPDLPLLSGLGDYTSGIGTFAPGHPELAKRLGVSNWCGRIFGVRIYGRALNAEEVGMLVRDHR